MPNKPRPPKPKGKGFTLRPLPEESGVPSLQDGGSKSPSVREPFENLGELPHGYGVDTIFLIAQEPHWLFTYWDIDIARHPGGAAFLRYHLANGFQEGEIEVPFETRNWYVPVEQAGADYYVEIGFYRGETWNLIARSLIVTTPPESMATSDVFDYATVPFHLSFQRMLDQLENARQSGEDLLAAVARLQNNGDFSVFGVTGVSDLLSDDQRAFLHALLGPGLLSELSSGGKSASEIEARIRAFFEEQLCSGGSSETINSFRDHAALFSGGLLSSAGAPSSGDITALASWAAGAISSWGTSGPNLASWGETTSWSGAAAVESVGGSAETSWTASVGGSWAQAALGTAGAVGSSWLQGIESSGILGATLTSWLQGVHSSWAEGALGSSWTSAEVSSWLSASVTTSHGGNSETLSSFSGGPERNFFMHVNAEVIFYGGTHPQAKVTIGGTPIALQPDGTFRYHFLFPNADYQIPIVAESPDGVETRSATLTFQRTTAKIGSVTDTSQPPLGEPMGKTLS